jgi:beta-galactosidase
MKGEFDLREGRITSYVMNNDRGIMNHFPEPYFWRAPTDNDFGNNMPINLGVWRTAHVNRTVKNVQQVSRQKRDYL